MKRSMPKALALLGSVLSFWLLLPGFVFLWVDGHPHREPIALSPRAYGLDYRDVALEATDGVKLSGWFLPAGHMGDGPGKAGLLLVHGLGENRDGMLDQAAYLNRRYGFAVLLIDLRGHGRSGRSFYTYGVLEADDVRVGLARGRARRRDQATRPGFWVGRGFCVVLRTGLTFGPVGP